MVMMSDELLVLVKCDNVNNKVIVANTMRHRSISKTVYVLMHFCKKKMKINFVK